MAIPATDRWPDEILDFWFGELGAKDWFSKNEAVDAQIQRRFRSLHEQLSQKSPSGFLTSPSKAFAAIILFDQLPRNLYRNDPRSFASDLLALDIARELITKKWDANIAHDQRVFAYLPFEHSENLADQDEAVRMIEPLGDDDFTRYAHTHRNVIVRFGRFPHRNTILGRTSTPQEKEYLRQPGSGF
ncbi:MAG: DUF924 family protein [Erythrobacter sp.]|uniref:DUF924 family protein n=1 Tax=Erythrobacter sp. TaxID=1042 RepID=UPI003264B91A